MRLSTIASLGFALIFSQTAPAAILLDLPYGSSEAVLDASDPTIQTRIGRDGIPSDWSFVKPFPGTFGDDGPRAYDLFEFDNAGPRERYFQVILDDLAETNNVFAASYLKTFDPTDLSLNYMGDPGFSPPAFGLPVFYQVIVPAMSKMLVVVNQVEIGPETLPVQYGLLVESFGTPYYSEIPEPSTIGMSLVGFSALLYLARRKRG